MNKIKSTFLGDYIDRGVDSAGVIDFIMNLKEQDYDVYTLRGNHEENLIDAHKNYEPKLFQKFVERINKSANLLDEEGKLKTKYIDFVLNLPYFIELEDFWLVHAGFNTNIEDTFSDTLAMLETRRFEYDEEKLKGKKVIHGHQVIYLSEIEIAIKENKNIIPLDNGCVYSKPHKIYDYKQVGNLCCLNMDTKELILQRNIDE
ncbi:metallophosphoesterase [Thermoflexibacter ruber]|nr:metallophosphoesterase [Thermoflexibacter ruber]